MSSERSRLQWDGYAQARAGASAVFHARDELHQFPVGAHMRCEVLSTGEVSALLDEAGVEGSERDELAERVQWGLALVDSYARQLEMEDEAYTEVREYGGFEI